MNARETRPPNPRGDKRGTGRSPEEPRLPTALWLILAVMGLGLVAQGLFVGPRTLTISYTDFKNMVRSDGVAEVVLTPTEIRGTRVAATADQVERFTVVRVDDPNLIAELETHGVQVSGESASNGLAGLLVWLLPFLILVWFSTMLFRQAGGAQRGALGFARSRARVYAEDDVTVTFADVAGVDEAVAELQLPLEERYLLTRTELTTRLAVLLGGRAAEEVTLGGNLERSAK